MPGKASIQDQRRDTAYRPGRRPKWLEFFAWEMVGGRGWCCLRGYLTFLVLVSTPSHVYHSTTPLLPSPSSILIDTLLWSSLPWLPGLQTAVTGAGTNTCRAWPPAGHTHTSRWPFWPRLSPHNSDHRLLHPSSKTKLAHTPTEGHSCPISVPARPGTAVLCQEFAPGSQWPRGGLGQAPSPAEAKSLLDAGFGP